MEKYWTYCHKILLLSFGLLIVSCNGNNDNIDLEKSQYYFDKVISEHYRQGSEIEQTYLDSAIFYNARNAEALFEKSTWQIKIGSYAEYFKYMDRAVEVKPEVYLGWRGVIKLHYLKDYDGAIADLNAFNKLFPKLEENAARGENTDYLLGLAHMGLNDFNKAIEYFTKHISISESKDQLDYIDNYVFVNKAICHISLDDFETARFELNRAISNFANCSEAYYYLGMIKLNLKEKDACSYLKKAFEFYDKGYYKNDPYRDVHNQLYLEDIKDLLQNCDQ